MTDIAAQLRELSQPWEMGDKIKRAIERAAKRSGLSYWRVFDLWYGKARRIEQFEIDQVAAALAKKRKEEMRNAVHECRAQLARLESMLVQVDSDFHRETIAHVRSQIRKVDGKSRADDSAVDC